jgi:hypothetical protein
MGFHRVLARMFLAPVFLVLATATALAGDDWKPIEPAQLALKEPVVEKAADAEAIFWEVQVDLSWGKAILTNYIRIKIFTERGKERNGRVDLRHLSSSMIDEIAGRTIKSDGSIVELTKDAIFEATLVKLRDVKINAKTFVMPAVEPGAIIEYRWREVREHSSGLFARLSFQRDIPIQRVEYTIRMRENLLSVFRTKTFNMKSTLVLPDKDKRFIYTMTNVPAFREEPHMPPVDQVRSWILTYHSPPVMAAVDLEKELYGQYKSRMKVNDEVKRAAVAAIGDATTPEQRLERIFEFCRTKIKNVDDDASGLTDVTRAKLKENKTAADTLNRGTGTGEDINILFGALAGAAGIDARVAHIGDRGDVFFNPVSYEVPLNMYFMRSTSIAVRTDKGWRFFDPASTYVPFGMLRWQEEGSRAMIFDTAQTHYVTTPVSPAEKTVQKRTAQLRLSEDGVLEGDVRIEYSGHFAVEKKEENDDYSVEQREKNLRDMIKGQMSTAEVSNILVENATDPVKPFIYSFHVRVPSYAQRTGKRLFLQPAFFQKGVAALFTESKREHQIYFHYSWSEDDAVNIDLPAGFSLENAESPQSFTVTGVGGYKVKISVVGKAEALQYRRTFSFDSMILPASSYGGLKLVFDRLHDSDNHTITLRQGAQAQ